MRRFTFIAAVFLALMWLGLIIWARAEARPIDISGAHGVMLFLVVPATLLAVFRKWLPLAAGLSGLALFVSFSALVASQISNH